MAIGTGSKALLVLVSVDFRGIVFVVLLLSGPMDVFAPSASDVLVVLVESVLEVLVVLVESVLEVFVVLVESVVEVFVVLVESVAEVLVESVFVVLVVLVKWCVHLHLPLSIPGYHLNRFRHPNPPRTRDNTYIRSSSAL